MTFKWLERSGEEMGWGFMVGGEWGLAEGVCTVWPVCWSWTGKHPGFFTGRPRPELVSLNTGPSPVGPGSSSQRDWLHPHQTFFLGSVSSQSPIFLLLLCLSFISFASCSDSAHFCVGVSLSSLSLLLYTLVRDETHLPHGLDYHSRGDDS